MIILANAVTLFLVLIFVSMSDTTEDSDDIERAKNAVLALFSTFDEKIDVCNEVPFKNCFNNKREKPHLVGLQRIRECANGVAQNYNLIMHEDINLRKNVDLKSDLRKAINIYNEALKSFLEKGIELPLQISDWSYRKMLILMVWNSMFLWNSAVDLNSYQEKSVLASLQEKYLLAANMNSFEQENVAESSENEEVEKSEDFDNGNDTENENDAGNGDDAENGGNDENGSDAEYEDDADGSTGDDTDWKDYLDKDIQIVKYITKGNYGRIYKVQEKLTSLFLALKAISKFKLSKGDPVDEIQIRREEQILKSIGIHPFLVNFHSSFETPSHIVMIMSFVEGISMEEHLYYPDFKTLSDNDAAFYIAEISLALHFLHKNGVMHRDIKIANIMIDIDGHIKLIDFGASKSGLGFGATTSTLIWTDIHAAPEILQEKPYTFATDWYALGIALCYMLTGDHPFMIFDDLDHYQPTYEDYEILHESALKKEFKIKKDLSNEAFSILERLLEPDPELRLASHDDDNMMEIKDHVFLNEIDWDKIKKKSAQPPFLPQIKDYY